MRRATIHLAPAICENKDNFPYKQVFFWTQQHFKQLTSTSQIPSWLLLYKYLALYYALKIVTIRLQRLCFRILRNHVIPIRLFQLCTVRCVPLPLYLHRKHQLALARRNNAGKRKRILI